MQAVGVSAPDHKTTCKFVHDHDFPVAHDIILVEFKKLVRFKRLLNVVVEIGVLNLGDIVNAEKSLRFSRTAIGKLHRFIFAVNDIIPIL